MNSNALSKYKEFGFVKTPLVCVDRYCDTGNLYIKLEGENLFGNIKGRCAFYMLEDAVSKYYDGGQPINIVESSSGNLALALHRLSGRFNVNFLCLSDRTTPKDKQKDLLGEGVNVHFVPKKKHVDFRSARISMAKELHEKSEYIWINQYNNSANAQAHYQTTGPEIWEQTNGDLDWIVLSVGSGGTISGVAKYLKRQNKKINVIGVEPLGSTSFGGVNSRYVTAGAGMCGPSNLLKDHMDFIDFYVQVPDNIAAFECKKFMEYEGISVGLTTGHCLAVASTLATNLRKKVVVISPDSGEHYKDIIYNLIQKQPTLKKESMKITPIIHP